MNSSKQKIVLGSRGSELALTQTRMVHAALEAALPGIEVESRVIQTVGDKRPDLKLSEFSSGPEPVDKGIFTRELESALGAGEIDAAVHSLKDVPTELDDGFKIAAVMARAPVEDVLVSKSEGGIEGIAGWCLRGNQQCPSRPATPMVTLRSATGGYPGKRRDQD